MENSEHPDLDNLEIPTASLEGIRKDCLDLAKAAEKFVEENEKSNRYNKLEYNVLYRNLGNLYKLIVNTSYLDLYSIPIQERLVYAEKKEFTNKIKDTFRKLLVELSELEHVDEENPFYQHL